MLEKIVKLLEEILAAVRNGNQAADTKPEPAPAPKKTTTAAKKQPEPEPEAEAEAEEDLTGDTDDLEEQVEVVTGLQITDAVKAAVAKSGRDKTLAVLGKYNAKKGSEVSEKDRPAALKALVALHGK